MAELQLRVQLEAGTVSVDQAKWEAFANDPSGPIVRDLVRRGNNVEQTARFDAPINTGTLAATLRTQPDFSGRLPAVDIVIGRDGLTPYTGYVINGTRPHEIRPIQNRPNAHLRWITPAGGVAFAKSVRHPGTRPETFMQRALLRAAD